MIYSLSKMLKGEGVSTSEGIQRADFMIIHIQDLGIFYIFRYFRYTSDIFDVFDTFDISDIFDILKISEAYWKH